MTNENVGESVSNEIYPTCDTYKPTWWSQQSATT